MGELLRQEEIVNVLIPLISRKWAEFPDTDKRLLPLFECFEQVIHAVGETYILPHVEQIYGRCIRILQGIPDSVRADQRDNQAFCEALFLRAMELISVILLTLGEDKATEAISFQNSILLQEMIKFASG